MHLYNSVRDIRIGGICNTGTCLLCAIALPLCFGLGVLIAYFILYEEYFGEAKVPKLSQKGESKAWAFVLVIFFYLPFQFREWYYKVAFVQLQFNTTTRKIEVKKASNKCCTTYFGCLGCCCGPYDLDLVFSCNLDDLTMIVHMALPCCGCCPCRKEYSILFITNTTVASDLAKPDLQIVVGDQIKACYYIECDGGFYEQFLALLTEVETQIPVCDVSNLKKFNLDTYVNEQL